ncbi:hypothetical protein BDB00DRAFT_295246 [Zychaea mexicana]|uniref:uncharacterized protein n=1 Tax=Zychaea mexicana TaxID=64656 RepID=UPI0022FF3E62|nr:uncharacterized protein BDB00DRAFT_295246 [Zychaea mexicana]KAI9494581.1 hypothetical protein BDB00DRAFT_295246 [Zychaea mexicana]
MPSFFNQLLAPFNRRRRKVTTKAVDHNNSDNHNNASRSTPLSPPQPETAPVLVYTTAQQQRQQEQATVVFSDQPRTSITSSSSVIVESLEFKASQELALSLDNWNDPSAVKPSFPAFEYLLHQQEEKEQERQGPRRSFRRLPRPLSLYRSNNKKSPKMARSTPNLKQQQ